MIVTVVIRRVSETGWTIRPLCFDDLNLITAPTIWGQIYNSKGVITMKNQNGIMIIGVDHGYGNIKTANCCFPTGIMDYESEPLFTADMLTYEGRC